MSSNFFNDLAPRYGEGASGIDVPWPTDDVQRSIALWCESAWEEASEDQKQVEEIGKIDQYIDYLAGNHWPEGRPSYRSKPVNNRMSRLFWELVAILTDIRPVAEIRATERVKEFVAQEDVINKTMRAWWRNNRIDSKVSMAIVYAILTTGFVKIQWNENLQFGMGDLEVRPISPRSLLPLKPDTDLQSSEAVIYQDTKSVGWLKRKYPLRAHLIYPDIEVSQFEVNLGPPANVSPQLYQQLTPAMTRVLGRNRRSMRTSAYPMCRYREFWIKDYSTNTSNAIVRMGNMSHPARIGYLVKPGERFYPRGRLIVMAGRQIVEDCPNPYWHGQFPFAMCRLNVVPWQLYGMSDMRSWKDLQDIINQIFAGVLDMIKRAVNPPMVAPSSAIGEEAARQIDLSMPGAKVIYKANSPSPPRIEQTAQLPGFVLQFLQGTEREMDQQSGIATVDEAMRKKQIPGGDTLDQIRNSKQTPIRMKGRNIEDFVCDCGTQMVPNFFQFYTKERRIFLLGSTGSQPVDFDWKPEVMAPVDTNPAEQIRKFRFEIVEGSLLSIQRVEKTMNLAKLRMNREIDRRTFFEGLDKLENVYFDADVVEANLKKEMAEGLSGPPPKAGKKGQGGLGSK
jgi:hypothetical protein